MSEQTDSKTAEVSADTDGTAPTTAGRSNLTGRGTSRRRVLGAAVGTGLLSAIAGCTGGGDGDGDSGDSDEGGSTDDQTPTATATETDTPTATISETATPTESEGEQTIESICEIQNELSGFTVVGCQSEIADDELIVTVTIRNDGEQEAELPAHNVEGIPYTSTETSDSPNFSYSATANYRDVRIAPGKTGMVSIRNRFGSGVSPADIQHYVVTLSCETGDNGIYCE